MRLHASSGTKFDAAVGAAFGTAKSGIGIAGLGTFKPELIMKVRH